ncbi:immunoglobulin domain-containing protein [Candidatus Poribacteria bacterium]|nr:immunoglobulin domain-containing protein [Candidatus Poribacteria bacterium]
MRLHASFRLAAAVIWAVFLPFAALAQLTVEPLEISTEAPVGTGAPDESFTVTGMGAPPQFYSVHVSNSDVLSADTGIGQTDGETDTVTLSFNTDGLPAGQYYEFCYVMEEFPARQDATFINVVINVYTPGPPAVGPVAFEGSPIEVYADGVAVDAGDYAGLFVTGDGTPPLHYRWEFSRDGDDYAPVMDGPGVEGSQSTYLEQPAIEFASGGFYRCRAGNSLGEATSPVFFVNVLSPPFLTLEPEDATVAEDTPVSFTLIADGSPDLDFEWFYTDGTDEPATLLEHPSFEGTATPTLTIPSAQPGDAGFYYCNVTNGYGSVESRHALLTVIESQPPAIVTQPLDAYARLGDAASFAIDATGREPLSYAWLFSAGGEIFGEVTVADGYTSPTEPRLGIPSVTLATEGHYRCRVTNPDGEALSAVVTLTVVYPPSIVSQSGGAEIEEGESADLFVEADGTEPFGYSWLFGTDPFVLEPIGTGRGYSGANTPNLHIEDAGLAEQGYYRCRVSNEYGYTESGLVRVTVNTAPYILSQPENVTVAEGGTATFIANVAGSEPLAYQWRHASTRRGVFTDLVDDGHIVGSRQRALSMIGAADADEGGYLCAVTNGLGSIFPGPAILTVTSVPPILGVNPTVLGVIGVVNENAPQAVFDISNTGEGTLSFSISDGSEPWIAGVSPQSGEAGVDSVPITVTFDTASLEAGAYTGTITVTDTARAGEPVDVTINLSVVEPFTVATLADDGPQSLRQVIELANSTPGPQTITFNVAGTIKLRSELPALEDPTGGTTIDGAGQVTLSGNGLRGFENGLVIRTAGNAVRNLTIVRFPGNGVRITGAGAHDNAVTGCRIGTAEGKDMGNRESGVRIEDGARDNTIGGDATDLQNHLAGNSFSGITIADADGNHLEGNNIGLSPEDAVLGNGGHGVHFLPTPSMDNIIGGTTVFQRSIEIGNKFFGTSVDVLEGKAVTLRIHTQGDAPGTYSWTRDGVATGGSSPELTISNALQANEGLYECTASNAAGSDRSRAIRLNVLSKKELVALALLPSYAGLDTNGDGFLSFAEILARANHAITQAARGADPFTIEDFNSLDTDGDGFLSVQEVIAGLGYAPENTAYQIVPNQAAFDATDIDEGTSGTQTVSIEYLGTGELDLVTTPTLSGSASEFAIVSDTGGEVLGLLESRSFEVASDPELLNTRTAYLNVRTDDFLYPFYPVLLSGYGFQTTEELLGTLLQTDPQPRGIGELDVNADTFFDEADIETNGNNGH